MANELRFYHLWSIRNILITVGVVSILILMLGAFLFYPQLSYSYKDSKFDSETDGVMQNIEEQTIIRQTKLGNKVEVDHYEVTYKYAVNGKWYTDTDIVKGTPVNGQMLYRIWNSDKSIAIKYLSGDPVQSMINLKIK